jgi:hypothetical protein
MSSPEPVIPDGMVTTRHEAISAATTPTAAQTADIAAVRALIDQFTADLQAALPPAEESTPGNDYYGPGSAQRVDVLAALGAVENVLAAAVLGILRPAVWTRGVEKPPPLVAPA